MDIIKDENKYKNLLKSLIVQALIKLMENKVSLRCFKNDIKLVESVLEES